MFPYQDPTGTDTLDRLGALEAYRSKLQVRYEIAAHAAGTRFVALDKLHQLKPGRRFETQTVTWEAFPIQQSGSSDERIDQNRPFLQEEYVEWDIQRGTDPNGPMETLTFCTEFPEYYEAIADVSFDALATVLREVMPDANPTVQELMGLSTATPKLDIDGLVGSATWSMLDSATGLDSRDLGRPFLRRGDFGQAVAHLQDRLQLLNLLQGIDGDFGPMTEMAVRKAQTLYTGGGQFYRRQIANNPWNNGQKGIHCLFQRDNRLALLFNLVSKCAIPEPRTFPEAICQLVGTRNCIPSRSSDPNVCSATQRAILSDHVISLQDPARIRMLQLRGIWTLNGRRIDINDPNRNQGIWQVSRGGQRGVLQNVPGLELDSAPIRTGSQVARALIVGVDVAVAEASALAH